MRLTESKTDLELLCETLEEIRKMDGKPAVDLLPRSHRGPQGKTDAALLSLARERLASLKAAKPTAADATAASDARQTSGMADSRPKDSAFWAEYYRLVGEGKSQEASAFFSAAESLGDAPVATIPQPRSAIPASARALLLEYQALAEMPIAQTLFAEENASDLAAAAETAGNDALDFSADELERARAAYLARASALIAKSQSFGDDHRARNEFHNAHETALSRALLIIEKYESVQTRE